MFEYVLFLRVEYISFYAKQIEQGVCNYQTNRMHKPQYVYKRTRTGNMRDSLANTPPTTMLKRLQLAWKAMQAYFSHSTRKNSP